MDDRSGLLAALGISTEDEFVYRALLAHPGATLAELAAATGWDCARVRRRTIALELSGLLTRVRSRPMRFTPAAPDMAADVLALRRRAEIERARLGAARLAAEFQAAAVDRVPAFEVLRGREAIAQRLAQAQRAATSEILVLDRLPGGAEDQDRLELELLARGTAYRVLYHQSALESAERLRAVRNLVDAGEQARVADSLPLRMVVFDGGTAIVPLDPAAEPAIVLLGASVLLDGLLALFDLVWRRATPLFAAPGRPAGVLTGGDEELLAMCAAGLTDKTIARRLGIAQRTVERRMHDLMDRLGARTRFQAGLRAADFLGPGGNATGRESANPNS